MLHILYWLYIETTDHIVYYIMSLLLWVKIHSLIIDESNPKALLREGFLKQILFCLTLKGKR